MFAFFTSSDAGAGVSAPAPVNKSAKYGLMCCSASPAVVEAVAAAGADWICLDAQHGAVSYDVLSNMLCSTSSHKAKRIVRVGGPDDRYGIQQALE
jgi:2-keto-3-deoxy-L-rhamnonate aldolase RhmA